LNSTCSMDFSVHFSSPSVILLITTNHKFGDSCNVQKSYADKVKLKNSQDWVDMENRNKCSENKDYLVEYEDKLKLYNCIQVSYTEVFRLSQQLACNLFSFLDSGTCGVQVYWCFREPCCLLLQGKVTKQWPARK
jgi:hypothetical protein